MTIPKYKDPTTGQWLPVGLPKSPEIPISDTPPTNGRWWLDTSEEGELEMYGMKMELLWENASRTSEFAAQTVNLDLSPYKFCEIVFIWGTSDAEFATLNVSTEIGVVSQACFVWNGKIARKYTVSNSGIAFDSGLYAANSSNNLATSNGKCIPYRIYGIKEGVS